MSEADVSEVSVPDAADTERRIEALLFAAAGPLSLDDLAKRLPEGSDVEAAVAAHPNVDVYRATFKPLQNRVAGRDERMLVKLVVDADTDRVLGFHAVGPHAGELAQLVGIAVKMKATKADFDATVAVHPTVAEEIVTMRKPAERHRRNRGDEHHPNAPAGSLA